MIHFRNEKSWSLLADVEWLLMIWQSLCLLWHYLALSEYRSAHCFKIAAIKALLRWYLILVTKALVIWCLLLYVHRSRWVLPSLWLQRCIANQGSLHTLPSGKIRNRAQIVTFNIAILIFTLLDAFKLAVELKRFYSLVRILKILRLIAKGLARLLSLLLTSTDAFLDWLNLQKCLFFAWTYLQGADLLIAAHGRARVSFLLLGHLFVFWREHWIDPLSLCVHYLLLLLFLGIVVVSAAQLTISVLGKLSLLRAKFLSVAILFAAWTDDDKLACLLRLPLGKLLWRWVDAPLFSWSLLTSAEGILEQVGWVLIISFSNSYDVTFWSVATAPSVPHAVYLL